MENLGSNSTKRGEILLKGVGLFNRNGELFQKRSGGRENGSLFRLNCKENVAWRFLFISVNNVDGRRHAVCVLEVRGLVKGWVLMTIKGWVLMVEQKRELGFKKKRGWGSLFCKSC